MNIEQLVLEKLREVLGFVEFLECKSGTPRPWRSLKGLWADLGVQITEEDIDEARREMWSNFPREDI
ncbi:MAG: hypothetical protein ACE5JP_01580 [Candidatus Bipolaricaulia bacterium]